MRHRGRRYWLFKTEPESFSIQDLAKAPHRTTCWDGVRNYQARNLLRDEVRKGDGVLLHHSNADPPAIAGTAIVVRESYPDPTAFDSQSPHHDPKSRSETPTWFMVDIALDAVFETPLPMALLKTTRGLEAMILLQRGSRLSIQPVTPGEWKIVHRLAGRK